MTEHYTDLLLISAKSGNLQTLKEAWLKTENRNETDFLGHNALTLSIIHEHFEVFRFLVDSGANVNVTNRVFSTFGALCRDRRERILREFQGRDSFLGGTPLICAVRARNLQIVQYLLEKGADPNGVDEEDRIALYYAILKRCDREMVDLLIQSGSEIDSPRDHLDEYATFHYNFGEYWDEMKAHLEI